MSDDRRRRPPATRQFSDLVGAEVAIAAVIWLVVVLVCFFFVGPVAGIAALLVGVIVCGLGFAAAIKQADISD